ncbi:hypothetical protein M5689_015365 [Euphorbia peplus]|nr:hypothetical protein M5689_015365 [Euphorbia peplus]
MKTLPLLQMSSCCSLCTCISRRRTSVSCVKLLKPDLASDKFALLLDPIRPRNELMKLPGLVLLEMIPNTIFGQQEIGIDYLQYLTLATFPVI